MAQLNDFSGGLNIRVTPYLISSNEAQKYINVDNSSMSLRPIKTNTNELQTVYKYMFNFLDTWVSSSTAKGYIQFQNKLYYSDGIGVPQKSSDGITFYNLGILQPANAPTISSAGTGVLDGTIQYCYTYYNINDGTESIPSTFSSELVVSAESIDIQIEASADPQVTTIRLYRLGGNLTTMQLVDELSNTTQTYTDNIEDLSILGNVLDSYNNGQAKEKLKHLTEANAMLFGAIDDKLYYSDIAFPNSWSAFNFIDFDYNITGIGAVPNGLLVFTEFRTYIVPGTSPSTLSKYLLNGSQGCVDHRSIQYIKNTLVWLSTDGICISSGGEIKVVSRDKIPKEYISNTINGSVVYDDVYYLAHSTGILCFDFRFGLTTFRELDTIAEGLFIYQDILYYSYQDTLYSLATGSTNTSMTYKSPMLADSQISNLKNYKSIYVKVIGTLNIKISIDNNLVITKDIDNTTSEVLVPQEYRKGYAIDFEISGTGELLEIQYVVEGRQNGK